MLEAAGSDPEIATQRDEEEQRRLATVKIFLNALPHRGDALADTFWLISSPEAYLKLTTQRGWTAEQWADWVFTTIKHLGA